MAGGIGIDQGVVDAIAIAVEALALRSTGGKFSVGLDEAGDFGVVVAGVVVVEAGVGVEHLAGVAVGEFEGAGVVLVVLIAEGAMGQMAGTDRPTPGDGPKGA